MVESSECDSFLARNCKTIFLRRLSLHAVSKLILYTDWNSSHTLTKGILINVARFDRRASLTRTQPY